MHKTIRAILMLGMIYLAVLACTGTSSLLATPTPPPSPTASQTPTPKVTPTRTPTSTTTPLVIETGATGKITSGGFLYAPLKGFDVKSSNYEVFMQSPDDNIRVLISANPPYPSQLLSRTLDNFVDYMKAEFKDVSEGPREKFELHGAKGVTVLLTVHGHKGFISRVAILRPASGKELFIHVTTYEEGTWEAYGETVYQAILQEISFFELKPQPDCPVTKNPDYGFKKDMPIKVGGGSTYGKENIRQYIQALMGPDGKVVPFYNEDDDGDGPILEYHIAYGTLDRILFFDIESAEALKVPFGMSCSGPFEGS